MLADSHCHLDWFKNPAKKVSNASDKGVSRMLSNATGAKSLRKNLALSEKFSAVHCALGLHPGNALSMSENETESSFAFVEKNIAHAAAVGEIGLDFKYAASKGQKNLQENVFRRFISLAADKNKPVVVHARYAESRCLDILEEMGAVKVHMHWFTNSKKTAARAVSLGFYISCGPIIFFDAASAEVVKLIPLENLLLETDAPVAFEGKESEPSWIPRVCGKVAELKGVSFAEVEAATGKNFSLLFKKSL